MATTMPHASSAPDMTLSSTEIQNVIAENLHSNTNNHHQPTRTTSAPPLPMDGPLPEKNQETQSDYEKKTNKLHQLIKDDFQFIDDAYKNLGKYKDEVEKQLKDAEKLLQGDDTDTQGRESKEFSDHQLFELKKHVMKLKTEIPSKVKVRYTDPTDAKRKEKPISQLILMEKKEHLAEVPSFYKKDKFKSSEIFKEFEASFKLLTDPQHKLCLLCFAVFPEGAAINKRLLMYWWIGEGFIRSDEKPEDTADKVLKELVSKNFLEPVYDKCPFKEKSHSYKLQPLAYTAVIMLAKRENFFDFDDNGYPMKEHARSLRSCLLKEKKSDSKEFHGPDDKNNSETKNCFPVFAKKSGNAQTAAKPMAHVVFNLSETFLRLKPEWFTEMKLVNILYLGKWNSTAKLHIEVEYPDVLKGIAGLKYVKFLSLQGISGITEIPDSISKLWNLRILDLRACHNLEVIPQGIGSLHNLTHLDISECYLLSRMPKDLSKLTNLLVLKGFEVQDTTDKQSCTLEDLTKMEKLYKLSIHTEVVEFPRDTDLPVLQNFRKLRILTIEWGGNMFRNSDLKRLPVPRPGSSGIAKKLTRLLTGTTGDENVPSPTDYPLSLEKLDLKCYPKRRAPTWLKPNNLKELKKLYIRGGELRELGQLGQWGGNSKSHTGSETKWKVETLRLKYLIELEMDWTELRGLFPELKYLEKVKCAKLTMFPCNAHGVWKNKEKTTF